MEAKKIFGGIDLSKDFPELGQSALFCVTEIHTLEDIDNLVQALKEVSLRFWIFWMTTISKRQLQPPATEKLHLPFCQRKICCTALIRSCAATK